LDRLDQFLDGLDRFLDVVSWAPKRWTVSWTLFFGPQQIGPFFGPCYWGPEKLVCFCLFLLGGGPCLTPPINCSLGTPWDLDLDPPWALAPTPRFLDFSKFTEYKNLPQGGLPLGLAPMASPGPGSKPEPPPRALDLDPPWSPSSRASCLLKICKVKEFPLGGSPWGFASP
jgi:hypothetical protein